VLVVWLAVRGSSLKAERLPPTGSPCGRDKRIGNWQPNCSAALMGKGASEAAHLVWLPPVIAPWQRGAVSLVGHEPNHGNGLIGVSERLSANSHMAWGVRAGGGDRGWGLTGQDVSRSGGMGMNPPRDWLARKSNNDQMRLTPEPRPYSA
jgi:hypothetical protein